jgi:chloramphenicol O-acetyltransferase
MPVSVEANHTIMDGLHVGRYFQRFEEIVNTDLPT